MPDVSTRVVTGGVAATLKWRCFARAALLGRLAARVVPARAPAPHFFGHGTVAGLDFCSFSLQPNFVGAQWSVGDARVLGV